MKKNSLYTFESEENPSDPEPLPSAIAEPYKEDSEIDTIPELQHHAKELLHELDKIVYYSGDAILNGSLDEITLSRANQTIFFKKLIQLADTYNKLSILVSSETSSNESNALSDVIKLNKQAVAEALIHFGLNKIDTTDTDNELIRLAIQRDYTKLKNLAKTNNIDWLQVGSWINDNLLDNQTSKDKEGPRQAVGVDYWGESGGSKAWMGHWAWITTGDIGRIKKYLEDTYSIRIDFDDI